MDYTHATCGNCGEEFDYLRIGKPRALCSDECRAAKRRDAKARYRKANPELIAASQKARYSARRDHILAVSKAWRAANGDRVRAKARLRKRFIPPEVKAEIQRRRRARKKALTVVHFTVVQLEARLSMFAGCWMCGAPGDELDHVKPLSRGGAHMLGNIRRACRPCNAQKHKKWPYPTAMAA